MSILIKGMEIPKSCSVCPMLEGYGSMDGLCHAANKWLDDDEHWTWYVYPEGDMDDSKPINCPLVPVPPHGDLIDRDEQIERAWRLNLSTRELIDTMLKSAPTIIPAEE